MTQIVWVGTYQEDIKELKVFGSISKFGLNKKNHFVFQSDDNISFNLFIEEKIKYFKTLNNQIKFYFYDPYIAYKLFNCINKDDCICLNLKENLDWLNNKSVVREWVRNQVKTPESVVLSKSEISLDYLKKIFWGYQKFVFQEMVSSGGTGTYLLVENQQCDLYKSSLYLVSPYYENSISINVTIIIGIDETIIFPPSIQYIKEENTNLLYMGSDFISINNLPQELLEKIKVASSKIANLLKQIEFKGICGIDFLLYNDDVYFLEINPRFQGSSFLIEKAINEYNLSIYKINFLAFYGSIKKVKQQLKNMVINYSFYKIGNTRKCNTQAFIEAKIEYNSNSYYDFFADKYHIMLQNWEEKIENQGKILLKIINKYTKCKISSVLDCTCGIGIQAISLAKEGLKITGTDISHNELAVAKKNAQKYNVDINFIYSDCRYLEQTLHTNFDAIISIDSALPHLVTRENFIIAFQSIYNRLNKGGVFLSSYRDYTELLKTKPNMAYPIRFNTENNIDYTIFRKWKWYKDIIYSRQYVIAENESKSILYTANYKQWAVTKHQLISIAQETHYSEIYWLLPDESGFSQPILCLIK